MHNNHKLYFIIPLYLQPDIVNIGFLIFQEYKPPLDDAAPEE